MRKIHLLIVLALFVLTTGGKCKQQADKNREAAAFMEHARQQLKLVEVSTDGYSVTYPPDSLIFASIERTGCFGTCPIYKVNVYTSGVVVYRVTKYVPNQQPGWYKGIMEKGAMERLIEKAYEINIFSFSDRYPDAKTQVADLPSTITYINAKGQTKRIHNGNYQHPEELLIYERYFDELLSGTLWEKVEPVSPE
jgi:hypothetical protein